MAYLLKIINSMAFDLNLHHRICVVKCSFKFKAAEIFGLLLIASGILCTHLLGLVFQSINVNVFFSYKFQIDAGSSWYLCI